MKTKADNVEELYQESLKTRPDDPPTAQEIARILKITPQYVSQVLRTRGYNQRMGAPPKLARRSAVQLLTEKGLSKQEIGQTLGISPSRVGQIQRTVAAINPNETPVKIQSELYAQQILKYEREFYREALTTPASITTAQLVRELRIPSNQAYRVRSNHPRLMHEMPRGKFRGIQCLALEPNGIGITLPHAMQTSMFATSIHMLQRKEPWAWFYSNSHALYPGVENEPECTLEVFWYDHHMQDTYQDSEGKTHPGICWYADHGLYCHHAQCEFLDRLHEGDQTCKAHAADCDCSLGDCLN